MPAHARRRVATVALAIAVLAARATTASVACAQEERSEARAVYDAAARAYEAKDYLGAARGFARADALAPNALALKLALAAALQAGDPVLAEELALRAESRDASPDVQELARSAHRMAKGRVGKLAIACAMRAPCVADVGGRPLREGEAMLVGVGPVVVSFTAEGGRTSKVTVDVTADGTARANEPPPIAAPQPAPAPAPAPRPEPARAGLDPVFFWIGVGATAALAGATVVSGLESNARYDDFARSRTLEARETGQSSELRTNILLGSAVVVALATGAVGLWLTRWGTGERERR